MNVINLGYSLKNVPTPTEKSYLKALTEKVEHFLTRIRWKAYFYDKEDPINEEDRINMNFGFKSNFSPPKHNLLIE